MRGILSRARMETEGKEWSGKKNRAQAHATLKTGAEGCSQAAPVAQTDLPTSRRCRPLGAPQTHTQTCGHALTAVSQQLQLITLLIHALCYRVPGAGKD